MSESFKIVGNTIKFKYINPKAKLKALTLNMTEDNELIQKLLALKPEDREPILNYIALHGKDLDLDTSSDLQKVSLSDKSPNSIYEKKLDLEKRKQFLEQAQKKLEAIKDRDEQQNRQLEDIKNEKQMIINELNSLNIGNISTASISSVGNLLISNIKTFDQLIEKLNEWFKNGKLSKQFPVNDLPNVLTELSGKVEELTTKSESQQAAITDLNKMSEEMKTFKQAVETQNQEQAKQTAQKIDELKTSLNTKINTLSSKVNKISKTQPQDNEQIINELIDIQSVKNMDNFKTIIGRLAAKETIDDGIYKKIDEIVDFETLNRINDYITNNNDNYHVNYYQKDSYAAEKPDWKKLTQIDLSKRYTPFEFEKNHKPAMIRITYYPDDYLQNGGESKEEKTKAFITVPTLFKIKKPEPPKTTAPLFENIMTIYNKHKQPQQEEKQEANGLKDWLTSKNVKTSISKQDERIKNLESMIDKLREEIKEIKNTKPITQQPIIKPNKPNFLNDVMNFSKNKLNKIEPKANQPHQPFLPLQENPNDILNKVFERRKDIEPDEYETSDDDWID